MGLLFYVGRIIPRGLEKILQGLLRPCSEVMQHNIHCVVLDKENNKVSSDSDDREMDTKSVNIFNLSQHA